MSDSAHQANRKQEFIALILLTGVVAPVITVAGIMLYGLMVWLFA